MIFTVVWKYGAEAELAQTWLDSDDRQAITAAANQMEQTLRERGPACGRKLTDTARVLVVPPLAAAFTASVPDRLVTVLSIWESSSEDLIE